MTTFNYEAIKDLIRCPKTHAELAFTGDALICCDPAARLRYPIVDGFPVLLVDEATELSLNDWAGIMKQAGRDPVTGSPTGKTPSKG